MYAEGSIIYADILFVINFSMDFLCLFITARLLNRKEKTGLLLLGAVAGALYGFLPYIVIMNSLVSLMANLISAGIICLVAFGKHPLRDFFVTTLTFIVSSALLGGLVTALYSLSGRYYQGVYREISPLTFALICLLAAVIALSYGLICRKKIHVHSAEVSIHIKGNRIRARLLADSGNLVTEPFSALPVIIISSAALPKPYDDPAQEIFPLAVRAIPFSTAAGGSCFFGFRPDRIEILHLGKKSKAVDAYIAVDTSNNNFSGYDGIMPTALL